jgi:endonuclease-3
MNKKLGKEDRYKAVLDYFEREHPTAETELHYRNPYELLVAVVLSAQCTDKRVNLVTPALFERFPDAQSLAEADDETIFPYIRSVSYPNNKAKHLAGLGKMLMQDFGGEVPSSQEQLQKLPGVGRKTANVIASVVFDIPAMAVDTHVFRVSARIGLTWRAKTPLEAEKQLMSHIQERLVNRAHHWLILHGRYLCLARKPRCELCPLTAWCRHYEQQVKKQVKNDSL